MFSVLLLGLKTFFVLYNLHFNPKKLNIGKINNVEFMNSNTKRLLVSFFYLFPIFAFAQKEISLEDIWSKGTYYSKGVYGILSMNDGKYYTTSVKALGSQFIVKYEYSTGNAVDTLFSADKFKEISNLNNFDSYSLSQNENKILLATDFESIYRHSYKADYYIYDIKKKSLEPLSRNGKQQLASFSPDANMIAFVRNNNIFIKDLNTNIETQITTDGQKNNIINGACDWVYEEEFGFDKAFAWNENSKKIAFYRFDESAVKEYGMPEYDSLYPSYTTFKYPKAGEKNSVVSIWIYDIDKKKLVNVDVGPETDQYIPRIKWSKSANLLSLIRMNRLQNKLELMLADSETGKTKTILTEKSPTYIDISDDLTFLNDNTTFIWSSELGGYNHLYHYNLDGKLIKQITTGNWDVISYKGFDEKSQTLFFTAAYTSSTQKDVCKIKINGTNFQLLSNKEGGTNEPTFSRTFDYYINNYSNSQTPSVYTINNNNGKIIRTLQDNIDLKERLKEYNLQQKEFFTIKTQDNFELNAWMIKPPKFDKNKKYPVMFVIYGGPGNNTVLNRWEGANYMWHQLLAQKGYIVVSVDNRGTGFKGEKFKKITYSNLGHYETLDQIEAARYFGSLPYIDKNRIGIQGWSFGGYLSSLCITKGNDVFKLAIAVAPVTNWRYYDTIYTERYLGLPKDNAKGYDDNSPLNFADDLKGKYLLIHGSSDDNVHYQNAAEMAMALQNANKQFDFMMYPNKNHGIGGGVIRLNLFTKMTDFITNNL